jgi:hypothetical protein
MPVAERMKTRPLFVEMFPETTLPDDFTGVAPAEVSSAMPSLLLSCR